MSQQTEGLVTKAELSRILNQRSANAWYNPLDAKIYTGEIVEDGKRVVPTYEEAVFDVQKYRQAIALKDAGQIDADRSEFLPWIGRWKDVHNERISSAKSAAVMTNTQYSTQDTVTVLNRLLNVAIRGFSMPDAVTTIPVNGLEYQIDVYSRFNISLDVPEGMQAFSKRGSVATTSFALTKDVGHIAATDEMILKNRQNLWGASIQNVATDFRRAKSVKIATVLSAQSETNVGDWDAVSSGLSTTNPIFHIQARQDAILANNGTPDVVVSHNIGWTAFATNTFTNGALSSNYGGLQPGISSNARGINGIPQLPGVTWYVDNELLPTDSVIVMDRESVVLVQGPTRVGQYRMEAEGIDGYVGREWYQVKAVQTGKIAELTTVTT